MVQVMCDICGKTIKNAHLDTNYVFRLGRDICMPCHAKLLGRVDNAVEGKGPYSFRKYWSVYADTVKKMSK
ncbi:MAG: hypothetical protein JW820_09610 [Spirochaetales bacterium]|nr:hypothetical protein [Spirochaetales bacterium]